MSRSGYLQNLPLAGTVGSLALVGTILLVVACASTESTLEAPPETRPPVIDAESPEGAADETPATSPSAAEGGEEKDDLTVVIEAGTDPEAPRRQTLLEAAAAERERRRTTAPPTIVITNENLSEHATGELTILSGPSAEPTTDSQEAAETTAGEEEEAERGEAYWRERVRTIRTEWRATLEEIEHLESRVADFRRRFYAEDDPYYRDTQIKPGWDRSLERLEAARKAAEGFSERLAEALEEGRQAGAMPGWLREGIELEPRPEQERGRDEMPEHRPQEPTVIEEEGR